MINDVYILAIETSCDDTSVAILKNQNVLSNIVSSQKIHEIYGGVVPELASRDHCLKIVDVLEDALGNISLDSIDQIAYTSGPGLLGALLIGESFAQGLSTALNIPLIPINHLEGHLMSPMMEFPQISMPFICLLVSGGHSMIVDVKDKGQYEIIGQSQDDAVGEAFDKVAKLLDLPYPGGPHIERLALEGKSDAFDFPRPMINSDNLNMSLSGLKTSVLYTVQKISNLTKEVKADIAASFQQAISDVLVAKIKKSIEITGRKEVIVAGGVAANKFLRGEFKKLEESHNITVYYPDMKYCGDNAAMIAFVGSMMKPSVENDRSSSARARWPLDELKA